MDFFKLFFLVFLSAIVGLASAQHDHGHGTSHIAISHKKEGHKFEYHIKHDKHHGSHHGSAHPHGYGGYGDSGGHGN